MVQVNKKIINGIFILSTGEGVSQGKKTLYLG